MRLPRLRLPGVPQHVVIRGNNGQTIFNSDHDYRVCLDYLADASVKYQCRIHAYALMPNHIHLLATPQDAMGVSQMVQLLARQYVQFFNKHYDRRGTLWEGRYKSALIGPDDCVDAHNRPVNYLLECYRYIENNPVRNQLVKYPGDYPWSSYHINTLDAGNNQSKHLENIDELIAPHAAFVALGDDIDSQRQHYARYCLEGCSSPVASLIRRETNRSRVIGDKHFVECVEERLDVDLSNKPRGGDHRSSVYKFSVQQRKKSFGSGYAPSRPSYTSA